MQLKLEMHHVAGCFSLIDAEGVIYSKGHVIQTGFYKHDDETAKAEMLHEMRAYARGISDGWNLARNALGTVWLKDGVEEYKPTATR